MTVKMIQIPVDEGECTDEGGFQPVNNSHESIISEENIDPLLVSKDGKV